MVDFSDYNALVKQVREGTASHVDEHVCSKGPRDFVLYRWEKEGASGYIVVSNRQFVANLAGDQEERARLVMRAAAAISDLGYLGDKACGYEGRLQRAADLERVVRELEGAAAGLSDLVESIQAEFPA